MCSEYVRTARIKRAFCGGLVLVLRLSIARISVWLKRQVLRTLCCLVEFEHDMSISNKIADAYRGLVRCALQTLQCPLHDSADIIGMKLLAVRILLCELGEGVMARQHLKDEHTNLIVLQTVVSLHSVVGEAHPWRRDSEVLMVKLLQFLYESFAFDDLWLSDGDYLDVVPMAHTELRAEPELDGEAETRIQTENDSESELTGEFMSRYLLSFLRT